MGRGPCGAGPRHCLAVRALTCSVSPPAGPGFFGVTDGVPKHKGTDSPSRECSVTFDLLVGVGALAGLDNVGYVVRLCASTTAAVGSALRREVVPQVLPRDASAVDVQDRPGPSGRRTPHCGAEVAPGREMPAVRAASGWGRRLGTCMCATSTVGRRGCGPTRGRAAGRALGMRRDLATAGLVECG